jgi:hypothetical protein
VLRESDIINIYLSGMGYEVLRWMELVQDVIQWWTSGLVMDSASIGAVTSQALSTIRKQKYTRRSVN